MFTIDPALILLLLVVGSSVALCCYLNLVCETFETLPYRRWLFNLPGYTFLYGKCEGSTDVPDRTIANTLAWLVGLYASILATAAPFVNKLLGMSAWLLSIPIQQIVLVILFDLCIVSIGYLCIKSLQGFRYQTRSKSLYRYLSLIAVTTVVGASVFYAMSLDVQFVVAKACKTVAGGIFGFLFFGAVLLALADKDHDTATGELGGRMIFFILAFLSFAFLASVVM